MLNGSNCAKLGELVMTLAEKGYRVHVETQASVIRKQVVYLRVTFMKNGVYADVTEPLTDEALTDCYDVGVLADAFKEKLSAEYSRKLGEKTSQPQRR